MRALVAERGSLECHAMYRESMSKCQYRVKNTQDCGMRVPQFWVVAARARADFAHFRTEFSSHFVKQPLKAIASLPPSWSTRR